MTYVLIAIFSLICGIVIPITFLYGSARKWWADAQSAKQLAEREVTKARAIILEHKELQHEKADFKAKVVSMSELEIENSILKQDLANVDITINRMRIEFEGNQAFAEALALALAQSETEDFRAKHASTLAELQELQQRHKEVEKDRNNASKRTDSLAERYLKEVERSVSRSINANNYASLKQRLTKAIEWCRAAGFDVPSERERDLLNSLKSDFELAVRSQLEREEQARIKARIREEERREREIRRELEAVERERAIASAALAQALASLQDEHSEEVQRLRARLAEAEERGRRAISQAQLTKAGHIYVISNIGSFGDSVFKIGMTRRLEPLDRIRELGDASVPFPFDVHMMISSEDAPSLENALHRAFHKNRVNRVNPRKEYFRVDLEAIREFVEEHYGEVKYTVDAEALEFRQSQEMSDEDEAFVTQTYDSAESDLGLDHEDE